MGIHFLLTRLPVATVFCVSLFRAFRQHNRLLSPCSVDRLAKRRLNLGLLSTHGSEKNTAKPVQVGAPQLLSESFDQSFRLLYSLKSFKGAIRAVPEAGRFHLFRFDLDQA
jgi:hypothetical protein